MHSLSEIVSAECGVAMLVFRTGRYSCAIGVDAVDCVVRAVAVDAVAGAPRAVLGIINFHGEVVPVLDLRRRLGDRGGALTCEQKLIIVKTARRAIALLADDVDGVRRIDAARVTAMDDIVPGASRIQGTVAGREGLILVQDARLLLTQAGESCLAGSLRRRAG